MATRLAERYGAHPALLCWHVSNEYANPCYCDTCAAAFRVWLQQRYASLDELNERWWTRFWSHSYTDWSQIEPPVANGETLTHGLTIDYRRFQSDSLLACFRAERDALRAITPDVPITTNLMGTFPHLDYREWAAELDVVSWDCYPSADAQPGDIAFNHDLHRGLKDGRPFMLMEQTPSTQNWQAVNALKRPGVLRLWSYAAVAHGADTVMYFQWRRSRGGSEKFHGAVIDHAGRSDTRVFQEVSTLGAELEQLGDRTLGAVTPSRVAVLFDWNNWWAIEGAIGPSVHKDYVATVRKHYRALWRHNVSIDIVFSDSDLEPYDLVVAPMLHMVKPGVTERVTELVSRGGSFVASVFSGVVDETDLAFMGYPGPLSDVLGIRVEEIDALAPGRSNRIVMSADGTSYSCSNLCEIVICEGAKALATYGDEFYAGTPVLTENVVGEGRAYYIASDPVDTFLEHFYGRLLASHGIEPLLRAPANVEVTVRETEQRRLLFVLNHGSAAAGVALPEPYTDLLGDQAPIRTLELPPYGVAILEAAVTAA